MSMAFFSEEDIATIPPNVRQEMVARGLLAPNQPGLTAPYTPQEDGGTGGGGTGGGGTGGGGTGGGTGGGGTGGPRFYGTNPELLGGLDSLLAELRGYAGTAGAGLINDGESEVSGFISGTFSFEDVRGALLNRLSQARQAVAGVSTTTPDPSGTAGAFAAQQKSDAFSRMSALLARFGLSDLEGFMKTVIASGAVDLQDPNALIFSLRGQDAYRRRFAANDARIKAGLPELDPSSYIALEEQYRQLLAANGLPNNFYNDQTDFQKWIEGDVSPAELQQRIQEGYRAVADADPQVRAQMKQLYDVSEGDLAAYFLDPERTKPLLTTKERVRQAQASSIAARGLEQGGMQLTKEEAEDLASRGITAEQAAQNFGEMKSLSGLYQQMTGEEELSRQQQIGATFRYDTSALEALKRRQRSRVAAFEGGGQFARTSGATSGTIETGAGTAQ